MSGPRWYDALAVGGLFFGSIASSLWLFRLIFELVAQRAMTGNDWVNTLYALVVVPFVGMAAYLVGYHALTGRWDE